MNFTITKVGIDALRIERNQSNVGYFTGFILGDNNSLPVTDSRTTIDGNNVYVGGTAEMNYSMVNNYEVIIRCVVEHDKGDFNIGSFAILTTSGVPFFIGKLDYIHHKQATTTLAAGDRFTIQVRFLMFDLLKNWTFSNLTENYTQFDNTYTSLVAAPTYPRLSARHIITVDNVIFPSGRSGYVLYPGTLGRKWRTPDVQMKHSDPTFFRFDGGEDGDGHLY